MISTLSFIANHPLSRGDRVGAFARFARWQIASRLRAEVETPWIGGARLVARHGMTGATGNIYCGLHEFADMAFLLHVLQPGDLFVDAGANVGSYTLLASKVIGAATVAFEPDPDTARDLARNIAANAISNLVSVRQVALGDHAGTVRFTVGLDTTNHVAGENETGRELPLARLDDFDLSPTFMKFDLEGFEEQAFAGARATLARPSLIALETELASPGIVALMSEFGFERRYYQPLTRTFGAPYSHGNALFIRDMVAVQARIAAAPKLTWGKVTF